MRKRNIAILRRFISKKKRQVQETLRKWPFVLSFARQCSGDYSLGKPNDKAKEDYVMRKGDYVLFQTYEMHRDPQYFPDPEKFDPERFSEENKKKMIPYTYLPFGAGPRNCIGARLAIYETKLLVYQLLKNFVLSPAPDTNIPAKIHKIFFTMEIQEGNRIRLWTRNVILNNM